MYSAVFVCFPFLFAYFLSHAPPYITRQYLLDHVQGVLLVHLHGATNLAAKDLWGTSDPYAILAIGPSAHRSATIPRSLNPVWDERMILFVRDPMQQRLTIKLADADLVGEDDPLGSTMRGLQDLVDGQARTLDLELVGETGHVQLEVQYLPMTGRVMLFWCVCVGVGGRCPPSRKAPKNNTATALYSNMSPAVVLLNCQ